MIKGWLVVILVSITTTAYAAVIPFSALADFTAAAGPQTVITFDGLPLGPVSTCTPVQPYTPDPCVFPQGPVTFVSTKGEVLGTIGLQRPLLSIESTGIVNNECPCAPDDFYATFEGHALGFDVSGQTGALTQVVLTEAGGVSSTFDLTTAIGVPLFFGATSDVGFTRVSWVAARNQAGAISNFQIDNVRVEATELPPTPVPEPTSLLLIGTGLAGMWRRR